MNSTESESRNCGRDGSFGYVSNINTISVVLLIINVYIYHRYTYIHLISIPKPYIIIYSIYIYF